MELNFAYSPCPNDTFVFSGIHSGTTALDQFAMRTHHHDIETLNRFALEGKYEITKMSFYTWLTLAGKYRLLRAGNALGYGCGPLLLSKRPIDPAALPALRVVLPGEHTTAHLLFRLFSPFSKNLRHIAYNKIFSALRTGEADCGVVIHEGRFVYAQEGLFLVRDLGEWWERATGAPVPLGCIGIRSDLPESFDAQMEELIRASLNSSRQKPEEVMDYVRMNAVEMDDAVIRKHIGTFVNDFTFDLGEAGLRAVSELRERARASGLLP